MKIIVIGGSGLLGHASILQLKNHTITAFSLNEPVGFMMPSGVEHILKDYTTLSDEALLSYLEGAYGLIFAAGIDERINAQPPVYQLYERINITPLKRLIRLAKKAGLKSVVVCGSYFSYFHRRWPHMKLYDKHPYIKSRVDQANMALDFADEDFFVKVVELPYIFGTLDNREPVWTILVDILLKQKKRTLYSKGGTTMITKRQAAQAIVGALFYNKSGNYPIGYYNYDYKDFLAVVHQGLAIDRPIYQVPNFLFYLYAKSKQRHNKKMKVESGLNLPAFVKLQSKHLYIDNAQALLLGVTSDDINTAIIESIKLSKDIILHKKQATKMTY